MAYSIDKTKNKIKEVKENIESKQGELNNLEKDKQKLLDAGMDIQNDEYLDESTKRTVMDGINQSLDSIADKGDELATEMTDDAISLEKEKQEVQKSMESNDTQKSSLEKKKNILDKMGLGAGVEKSINEINESSKDLDATLSDINNTEKELKNVSSKLQSLWNENKSGKKFNIKRDVLVKVSKNRNFNNSKSDIFKKVTISLQIISTMATGHSINTLYNQSVQEYMDGNVSISKELKHKADTKLLNSYSNLESKKFKNKLKNN